MTGKARKIKCDESRPSCQRCLSGKRNCEGYRNDSSESSSPTSLVQVNYQTATAEISRLCKIASVTLHQGSYKQYGLATAFWSYMVPQLGTTDECVTYAAAAFGAGLETRHSLMKDPDLGVFRHYGQAVKRIQNDLADESRLTVAIIAACILLAFTDVLLSRDLQALTHLQGTLALLAARQKRRGSDYDGSSETRGGLLLRDSIDIAGASLDVVTASFALGLDPRLDELSLHAPAIFCPGWMSMESVEPFVMQTLHAAFKFARTASDWKYVRQSLHPETTSIEQDRHITRLHSCIATLIQLHDSLLPTAQSSRLLVLKAQCTSCFIYLSSILEPYECAYDAQSSHFLSILDDCEELVSRWRCIKHEQYSLDFLPEFGVVQPLYLTAVKYRNPYHRQRAIDLLKQAGREGPFDGPSMVLVAQRVRDVEEAAAQNIRLDNGRLDVNFVPEEARVHGAGEDTTAKFEDATGSVFAFFHRCRDVDEMLATSSHEGYKEERHWESWREVLHA